MSIQDEARTEAEKRHPSQPGVAKGAVTRAKIRFAYEDGYIAGASRPVTDAEVKAAAKAVTREWRNVHTHEDMARAALEAAREVSR